MERLTYPVRLFETMGVGLFSVYGAHKAPVFGHDAEVAILPGIVAAVGGGMARGMLLAPVSILWQEEIQASALVGAALAVLGEYLERPAVWADLPADPGVLPPAFPLAAPALEPAAVRSRSGRLIRP